LKNYEDVKSDLIHMLEELEGRLDNITQDVRHTETGLNPDFAEQAVEVENDDVLEALGNQTEQEIEQIKQALSRMEQGTYGICLKCGKPIRKERLKALPFSCQCIQCAEDGD